MTSPTIMASEIAEQPDAVRRTIAALVPAADDLAALAAGRRHVLFVARGTSDNAAVYGRYLLEVHAGRRASSAAPSVATHYRRRLDLGDTLAVCVSQSGRTEEITETQAWAAACGAATVAITNDGDSPLAQAADLALVTRAGVERAVPATKSYTSQLAAMAVLAAALSTSRQPLLDELDAAPEEIRRLLDARSGVDAAVDRLAATDDLIVTGRGLVYGTALELALKVEETCLRPVRGTSYADLLHGPIAVVKPDLVAVLVAAADGPVLGGLTELAAELRSRGARTIGVGGDRVFADACDLVVAGPALPERVAPLGLIVPGQLIVESLARRLGLDPDAPQGLSKVTQSEPGTTNGKDAR